LDTQKWDWKQDQSLGGGFAGGTPRTCRLNGNLSEVPSYWQLCPALDKTKHCLAKHWKNGRIQAEPKKKRF
jgi:hypothetical protein